MSPQPTTPQRQPWNCYPNFIVCPNDHLLRFHESNYRADLKRLEGHAFLQCQDCRPHPTYFLAVFSTSPDPHVTCYEISREAFLLWDKSHEPTPATLELLYLLRDPQGRSLNPSWRPPKL